MTDDSNDIKKSTSDETVEDAGDAPAANDSQGDDATSTDDTSAASESEDQGDDTASTSDTQNAGEAGEAEDGVEEELDISKGEMMTQEGAPLQIQHPFDDGTDAGRDILLMRRINITEALDELFTIEAHVVSKTHDLDFTKIVGKEVGFSIEQEGDDRYFHGVVGNFLQYATADPNLDLVTWYELKVYPKLWLLTLSKDCRIFQNLSPIDIIKQILEEHKIDDVSILAEGGVTPREYCVQYHETAFDFITRLMQEEGIFYFFRHEYMKHTLVLADKDDQVSECEGSSLLDYDDSGPELPAINTVTQCDFQQRVSSLGVASNDYNMTIAGTNLYALSKAETVEDTLVGTVYAYEGDVDGEAKPTLERLEQLMALRMQEQQSLRKTIFMKSTAPYLFAGGKFKFQGHHREDINDKFYVVQKVIHEAQAGVVVPEDATEKEKADAKFLYRNTIFAFHDALSYRPARRSKQPRIESVQSAIVTGPEGEEIWVDEYGRVKVKFKWDRQWPKDDTSSCWVRVQQGMAGNNWGVLFTPRVGMEVLISFINGNPNRPVVTGCLYNSDHMPPYLAERITGEHTPTKTGIKTKSSKAADDGVDAFNELRFEDKSGEEQIYIRAQKDMDVYVIENETKHIAKGSSWTVIDQGDRHVVLEGGGGAVAKTTPNGQALPAGTGDDILTLKTGSRFTTFLSENGEVRDTTHVIEGLTEYQNDKGSMSRVFQDGHDKTTLVKGNREVLLKEGNDFHKIITGDRQSVIETGNRTHEITTGDDKTYIHTGNHLTYIETGDHKTKIDTGNMAILVGAGNKVETLKSGAYKLNLDQGNQEITIKAGDAVLTLTGTKKETVTGKYEATYTESFTLTVTGDVSIVSQGKVSVASATDLEFTAGANLTVTAGGNLTLGAGGAMVMNTSGNLLFTSGGDMVTTAGGNVAQTGGGTMALTGAGGVTISSGAAIAMTSGAALSLMSSATITMTDSAGLSIMSGGAMSVMSGPCSFKAMTFSVAA